MSERSLRRLKAFRKNTLNVLVTVRSGKIFFSVPAGSDIPEHTNEWHDLQEVVDAARNCSVKRDRVCMPYEYAVSVAVSNAFKGLRESIGSDQKLSTPAGMLNRLNYLLGKKVGKYEDHDELVFFLTRLHRGVSNRIGIEQRAIRNAAKKG